MSTYELWKKMIKSKIYTRDAAIRRVSAISPLLTDEEYESLIALIQEVYGAA